jgi:hypothetical protein
MESMAEACMSRLQCRGSIAGVAVVVILLWSRPADAQIGVDPGPPREPPGFCRDVITGAEYDIVNVAMAQHRLEYLQAKLRSDAELGDIAAADDDARRIANVQYRIAIHEWLIRWNSRQYPCFYPIWTDPCSAAAIAQAAHPTRGPRPQQLLSSRGSISPAPTFAITIINAEPVGPGIVFGIDGVTYQSLAGSRRDVVIVPGSYITYDSGGSLGERRYRISPGDRYEFRSTDRGWALYKLAAMPTPRTSD